jgi:hypothetical protein
MLKICGSFLLGSLLIVPVFAPVAAQQPTEAEREAIRSACRSDFMTHCASVQPGGKEALECLLQNDSKLSAPCKSAVSAVAPSVEPKSEPKSESRSESEPKPEPKPEPKSESVTKESAPKAPEAPVAGASKAAATQAQDDQIKAIRRACTLDDFMAHCSWISPSSPEVVLCLKANAAGLSPACRSAVASPSNTTAAPSPAEPARREQPASRTNKSEPTRASPSPSSPSATAAKTAQPPTTQQRNAIRAACRSDFVSHCSGVQPGGTKAFQCLQRNAAQLSAPCKSAVAAISGGAPASPPAAASENAPPPAAAPLAPMPALRRREALALLRICREDMQMLCAGIPTGGGRVISCLAEKASSLSPGCYGALAAARGY